MLTERLVLARWTDAVPSLRYARTGRFCEEDGYDFLLAPPVTAGGSAHLARWRRRPRAGSETAAGPVASAAPAVLVVVVGADRGYFDAVLGMGGEDAGGLTVPRFVVERRFPLVGQQLLIGRSSRSRGMDPAARPPQERAE